MSSNEPVVVGIAGSIRNRAGLEAVEGVDKNVRSDDLVARITDLEHRDIYHDDFLGEIQPLIQDLSQSNERLITNSDALVLTSLYGASDAADVEFHKLTDYVGLNKSYADTHVDARDFEALKPVVQRADGLILGSPVYFGDRSSLMHSFINFAAENGLLEGKVVSMVSCGSKRNGGQETTNVYALFETLDHGALIVGNGPKTCQYGGTGWGGDIGDVADDEFGLETSMGTGLRVSRVARLLHGRRAMSQLEVEERTPRPFTIGVVVTRDRNHRLQETIQRSFDQLDIEGVELNIINFAESFIQACIGCDVCPTPAKVEEISNDGRDYKCIIDEELDADRWANDDLQDLHSELVRNDALLIAALDTDESGIQDVYQSLLERTRYLRRDDWRLHNIPLAAYVVTEPGRSSTYPMKIMTSWMRHNTILHPPVVHTVFDNIGGEVTDEETLASLESQFNEQALDRLESFVHSAKSIRAEAARTDPDTLSYKATGYRNKILDQTTAERS